MSGNPWIDQCFALRSDAAVRSLPSEATNASLLATSLPARCRIVANFAVVPGRFRARSILLWFVILGGCRTDVVLLTLDAQVPDAGAGPIDAAAPPGDGAAPGLPSRIGVGQRIPWAGTDWYLHGADLPWRNYGRDFGFADGAASTAAELRPVLDGASRNGVRIIRWFMFTDDQIPFVEDAAGIPTTFAPAVLTDVDAALGLLEDYDLYGIFVLFAQGAPGLTRFGNAAQLAGVAAATADLVAHVAARSDRVVGWEINVDREAMTMAQAVAMTLALAPAIRAAPRGYLGVGVPTLGIAAELCQNGADYVGFVEQGRGELCGFCTTYAELTATGIACPVTINTFYALPDGVGLGQMGQYYDQGFAGAFAWSLMPGRTTDGTTVDFNATRDFAAAHANAGPR